MSAYGSEGDKILRQFGAKLGARRKKLPLSQEKLAEKTKLHRTYIGKLESGQTEPGMFALMILADALGVTVNDLINDLPTPKERKVAPNLSTTAEQ